MQGRHISLIVVVAFSTAWAADPGPKQAPQREEIEIDVVSMLMESTVRLQGAGGSATAFILTLHEAPGIPPATVLITAAHALESMGDDCKLTIRAAAQDGSWAPYTLRVEVRPHGDKHWVRHPTADIAAMFVNLEPNLVPKNGFLTTSYLVEDELMTKLDIRTGDEAFTLSFPRGVLANEDGYPILRGGRIGSYPLYPTRFAQGFVMDTELYEGEYGAPVVVLRNLTKEILGAEAKVPKGRLGVIVGLVARMEGATTTVRLQTVLPSSMIRDTLGLLAEAARRGTLPKSGGFKRERS